MSLFYCQSQEKKKQSIFKLHSVTLYYGLGAEDNFAFNDEDYIYKSDVIKASFYYPINQHNYQLGLSLQPQIHFLEHQLLNKYFVQGHEANFEILRDRYTQLKQMNLYALQGELSIRKKFAKKLEVFAFLSIGPAFIDTETERLSKGFTFIENLGIGVHYKFGRLWFFSFKPSLSHISNAELQENNSGYNSMNIEFGLGFNI